MDIGKVPDYEGSMAKAYASEVLQRTANIGVRILGDYGTLHVDSEWAPLKGKLEHWCRFAVCPPIMGGTSEIQRNIIATRGLGLPRG